MTLNPKLPLISVIIAAYNHEDYIVETINSVIKQTYNNLELIIIDDGSTDDTYSQVMKMKKECKDRFTHLYFKSRTNQGIIDTLNECLANSKGEFIYVIASDDVVKPQAITKLFNFLSNNDNYGLAVGDNEFIDDKGVRCYWTKEQELVYEKDESCYQSFVDFFIAHRKDIAFDSADFGSYDKLILGNHIPNGYLIRSELLHSIGGYLKSYPLEDYGLMLRLSKITRFKFIDEVLFSYRWHNTNTTKNREAMLVNHYMVLLNEREYILDNYPESIYTTNRKYGIKYLYEYHKRTDIWGTKYRTFRLFNIRIFSIHKKSRYCVEN